LKSQKAITLLMIFYNRRIYKWHYQILMDGLTEIHSQQLLAQVAVLVMRNLQHVDQHVAQVTNN